MRGGKRRDHRQRDRPHWDQQDRREIGPKGEFEGLRDQRPGGDAAPGERGKRDRARQQGKFDQLAARDLPASRTDQPQQDDIAPPLGAGSIAAWALVSQRFEFAFRPDLATILLIPVGSIALAVLAAFLAAQPALNARPAEGLRAL